MGARSVLSLVVWLAKLEKNDKVRHNMTQIASLLVVATVFIGLEEQGRNHGYGSQKTVEKIRTRTLTLT